jgi:tetratricopeptide (TPR) repeat protein
VERASVVAEAAVEMEPENEIALVAAAEARLARGDLVGARAAFQRANKLSENPNGYLLRRARLAMAEGDRHGALAHLRQLLSVQPGNGMALWFLAALSTDDASRRDLRVAMEQALARRHPEDQPLDFPLVVYRLLGDEERVDALLAEGLRRECGRAREEPSRLNCEAWFLALAGKDLDRALTSSQAAHTAAPWRSDYLDTLSVVHRRRGENGPAIEAARQAARLSPTDIYLVWQVERMAAGDLEP